MPYSEQKIHDLFIIFPMPAQSEVYFISPYVLQSVKYGAYIYKTIVAYIH